MSKQVETSTGDDEGYNASDFIIEGHDECGSDFIIEGYDDCGCPFIVEGYDECGTEFMSDKQYTREDYIKERLRSFALWPPGIPIKPRKLAEAGFEYTGYNDSVRCVYCGIIIRSWEKDDDPWQAHKESNPHCRCIKK